MKFDLLDYTNCIANLPNSILKKFGVGTVGDTLPIADLLYMKHKVERFDYGRTVFNING